MSTTSTLRCSIEWTVDKRLNDLNYADNICLFVIDMHEIRLMTELVVEESNKVALEIKHQEDRAYEDSPWLAQPPCHI